ncbi:MAG: T9SS type A sorting domain-containing protein, partial [Bacteroidota bacterium]
APLPVPTLSGPAVACASSTGNLYVTEAGMTGYSWTVSAGGIITAGGTSSSNTVTVTWNTPGAQTVSVSYTSAAGCQAASPSAYNVTVNPLPVPAITGSASVCSGSAGNVYTTQPGMAGYTWNISAGGTITAGAGTNSITVTWNTAGSQSVSVNYSNASGCAAATASVFNVTVNQSAVPVITGPEAVCAVSTGNIYSTQTGMTGYSWVVSLGGIITSGAGTEAITVNWNTIGTQWVEVNYTNVNGCSATSPSQLNVTVNPLPDPAGSISGTSVLCTGETGIAYTCAPVNGATYYVWVLPAGATIASGNGTNSITVDFASNASSGDITVSGNNLCGNGPVSPNFPVIVNPIPVAPVVNATGMMLTSSAAAGNQWYFSASQGGSGNLIPGATGQEYSATQTGWYWCVVNLGGCSSDSSNHQYLQMVGVPELREGYVTVYPVPNDGLFTVSISSHSTGPFTIRVFSGLGVQLFEVRDIHVTGKYEQQIDLRPAPAGLYTVVVSNGNNRVLKKVLIRK